MRVLIWCCGFEQRFAGQYVAAEAKRQGFDVRVTGSRRDPRQMYEALREYKPDVVFCFAIMASLVPYYEKIRSTGAKLVLWYPDMTESTRDRMWRESLNGVADMLIFSIKETAQRYCDLAPTVLWQPQYFDRKFCAIDGRLPNTIDGQLPQRLDPTKPIYDVCFIGSCDNLRRTWLDELQKHHNCRFERDGISRRKEIRGWEMAEIYAQSKIAININRQRYINSGPYVVSNRIYNAMGSGAFFLNHKVEQLDLMFTEGVDCVSHNDNLLDIRKKIDYYIANPVERETIAKTGQQRVLRYHTLKQRVKEYWHVMSLLYEGRTAEIESGANGEWAQL